MRDQVICKYKSTAESITVSWNIEYKQSYNELQEFV